MTSIITIFFRTKSYDYSRFRIPRVLNLCLICILFFGSVKAQNISFKTIGLNEGLNEISCLAIQQDSLNRMWFGTRNGLSCWDGIRMKTFYPERGDTTSLMEHKIIDIIQEGKYLWIQSSLGLSRLDLETLSFRRFYLDNVLNINLYNDSVLVGTRNGILAFDWDKEIFYKKTKLLSENNSISAVYQDKNKVLWFTEDYKNLIIKIENGVKEIIKIPISEPVVIFDLLTSSQNKLYLATRYHGIITYDISTKKFDNINLTSSPFSLKDMTVRDLIEDNEGRIWVGTFKGLAIFDLNKNSTSFIQSSDKNEHSLSHNSVHCLYLSKDENMWIGTYFGGVNYGKVSNQIFTKYNNSAIGAKPSFPVIGSMVEDEKKNIWIGTEGGGLDYFDRKNNIFKNYPYSKDNHGISQTNVKSLYLVNNHYLLIGTHQGGLNVLNIVKNEIKHYDNSIKNINSIIGYEDNYLLATDNGIVRFNLKSGSFTPFFDSKKLSDETNMISNCLYIDNKGIIWIGYEYSGLMSYNPRTKILKKYKYDEFNEQSIANNSINYIIEDHLSHLWIGTNGGGLCLYDRASDQFLTFNKVKNNLPSDFVYGITESRFGKLWISTSKGLSHFDVENKLFSNYDYESGFPLKELNYKALLLTNNGEVFVGGIDGLVSFKEEDLLLVKKNQTISFSSLDVNNKEVRANDRTKILQKDISVAKSFTLKPEHRVFKIDYTECNYNWDIKNKYQYQLVGFDNNWVNTEYNTSATYTNINPGKYTFKVRATDVIYNPITEEKTIEIIIKPLLSRTWYAYTFYVLFVISLILLFNYIYLAKMRLANQLNNEHEDKEKIKELNLHKLNFFTNISHEFMTPLTIILSSLENVFTKTKIPSNIKSHLTLAFRNAKRLKNLNNELLDFRKIEQGHLKLKIQENDIIPYINDIFDAFSEIALKKGIKYTFDKNTDHCSILYDPTQMDKVFYNLLSNAFNHISEKAGEVIIKLEDKTDILEISVIDNGVGIPAEEVSKVFNRFFQYETKYRESQYRGNGIGLALSQSIVQAHHGKIVCESEINKGATFTVALLKGNAHIDATMMSNEKTINRFNFDKELIDIEVEDIDKELIKEEKLLAKDAPLLLIVDDNPEIRLVVKNVFSDTYKIVLANNGQEGLDIAIERLPDIIISDVKMPKLSGFEMCEKLKRNINTSHIPIILLTALDTEEDRISGFKHGADSYCARPFNSEMLIAIVENLFKTREILQAKFNNDLNVSAKSIAHDVIDTEFLNKIQLIIEENILNAEFSVDELAEKMGISRTLFYHKVKTITGQTPNDFIQTIKLKKAANMLLNDPSKNISDVAYDTGFNSPRYFSWCFKNHFGVNPSKYIQNKNK